MLGGQFEAITGFYFSPRADLKVSVTPLNRFFKPHVKKVMKENRTMDELLKTRDGG